MSCNCKDHAHEVDSDAKRVKCSNCGRTTEWEREHFAAYLEGWHYGTLPSGSHRRRDSMANELERSLWDTGLHDGSASYQRRAAEAKSQPPC